MKYWLLTLTFVSCISLANGKSEAINNCSIVYNKALRGDVIIKSICVEKHNLYDYNFKSHDLKFKKNHYFKIMIEGFTTIKNLNIEYFGKCWANKDGNLTVLNNKKKKKAKIEVFRYV